MIAAESQIRESFLAALMLTGTTAASEQAVLGAIATLGCGVADDELLLTTAKCAIQIPDVCLAWAEIPSSLPPELRRLFLLSSVGRKCFVLRILMGLTLEVTSGILNLQKDEVDEALCLALSELPGLAGIPKVVHDGMRLNGRR